MSGTPRPVPNLGLLDQARTFSTKKERGGTPQCSLPPRPPAKSAPPFSRIFPHRLMKEDKAKAVSFNKNDNSALLNSPHYDEKRRELYFDQCFELVCKLGAGSFGEVYKVSSKEDGKHYAIKRSMQRFRGTSDRERKLEEVAKHEKLPKHPNCVEFVKAWEEKQHLYIQTELCKTSLGYYAESNHNIPEKLIWRYLIDLLMAVKHLQDHQLVHMDIKPENIFITETGQCKLGDFGLMLDLNKERDVAEAIEGDPKYMAPELMMGNFNMKADVFSLGITLLELATDLDLPRGGENWHKLRRKEFPGHVWQDKSPELETVIEWMMESDVSQRPMAAEVLQHPIIKKVKSRVRREKIKTAVINAFNTVVYSLLHIFWAMWMVLVYPLHSALPNSMTATPAKSKQMARPQEWEDTSYSDEDVLEDLSLNMSTSSMGKPLDVSTSSDGSLHNEGYFGVNSARLRAHSTPSGRMRHRKPLIPDHIAEPITAEVDLPIETLNFSLLSTSNRSGLCSPKLNSSIPSEEPSLRSFHASTLSITPPTPRSSAKKRLLPDGEEEGTRFNIAPKNLLSAFDEMSSDDE